MNLYSSPALNGQGFRAEISTGCNSNALVFSEAEGLSAGMTMVCETVENCHENWPYRGQHLSRQVSFKPLGFQGFEGNLPSENEGGPSLFSYCPLPETDTHGEALVSDHGDKDDARKSDVRRRAPTSTIVDPEDDFNATRGAHHAERILGRPLNWLLTWNIPTIRDAAPQDRAPLWKAERDTLRAFFRRNKEAFTYNMNRASMDRQGSGEHAHLLLHCPKRLTHKFVGFVVKQWGSPAADVRPASRHWWRKRNGRLQSALNYCLQGVSWGRAHAKGRDYKNGGTIAGKRTSWSDDIGPKAIAAYEVSNGIVTAG